MIENRIKMRCENATANSVRSISSAMNLNRIGFWAFFCFFLFPGDRAAGALSSNHPGPGNEQIRAFVKNIATNSPFVSPKRRIEDAIAKKLNTPANTVGYHELVKAISDLSTMDQEAADKMVSNSQKILKFNPFELEPLEHLIKEIALPQEANHYYIRALYKYIISLRNIGNIGLAEVLSRLPLLRPENVHMLAEFLLNAVNTKLKLATKSSTAKPPTLDQYTDRDKFVEYAKTWIYPNFSQRFTSFVERYHYYDDKISRGLIETLAEEDGEKRCRKFITSILINVYFVSQRAPNFELATNFLCDVSKPINDDAAIDNNRYQSVAEKQADYASGIAALLKSDKNLQNWKGSMILHDRKIVGELIRYISTVDLSQPLIIPPHFAKKYTGFDIESLRSGNEKYLMKFRRSFYKSFLSGQTDVPYDIRERLAVILSSFSYENEPEQDVSLAEFILNFENTLRSDRQPISSSPKSSYINQDKTNLARFIAEVVHPESFDDRFLAFTNYMGVPSIFFGTLNGKNKTVRCEKYLSSILFPEFEIRRNTPHFNNAIKFLSAMSEVVPKSDVVDMKHYLPLAETILRFVVLLKSEKNMRGNIKTKIALQDHRTLQDLFQYIHEVKTILIRQQLEVPAHYSPNYIGIDIKALHEHNGYIPRQFQQACYSGAFHTILTGDRGHITQIRVKELGLLSGLPFRSDQIDSLVRFLVNMPDDLKIHTTEKDHFNEYIRNILIEIYGIDGGETPHFNEAVLFLCAKFSARILDQMIHFRSIAEKISHIAGVLKSEKNMDKGIPGMIVLQDHGNLGELIEYIRTVKSKGPLTVPEYYLPNRIGIDIKALHEKNPAGFERAFYEEFLRKQFGWTANPEGLPQLLDVLTRLSFKPDEKLENLLDTIAHALLNAAEVLKTYTNLGANEPTSLIQATFEAARLPLRLGGLLRFEGIFGLKEIALSLLTADATSTPEKLFKRLKLNSIFPE